ncbi:MAG: hypothetical protein AAFO69_15705, partial [Bacteroidota bacterium]
MRTHILLLIAISLLATTAIAQEELGKELPPFKFPNNSDYELTATTYPGKDKVKYVITKNGEDPEEFTLSNNSFIKFKEEVGNIVDYEDKVEEKQNDIELIYDLILTTIGFAEELSEGPTAGVLHLRRDVVIRKELPKSTTSYLTQKTKETFLKKSETQNKKYHLSEDEIKDIYGEENPPNYDLLQQKLKKSKFRSAIYQLRLDSINQEIWRQYGEVINEMKPLFDSLEEKKEQEQLFKQKITRLKARINTKLRDS